MLENIVMDCCEMDLWKLFKAFKVAQCQSEGIDYKLLAPYQTTRPFPFKLVMRVARQLLEGLRDLEEQKIVHRDIKPENLLLLTSPSSMEYREGFENFYPEVRITDFGMAKFHNSEYFSNNVCTDHYRAPELIM